MIVATAAWAGPQWPRAETQWAVVSSIATGDRALDAWFELTTARAGRDRWTVRTTHSAGGWEEHGAPVTFDSDAPSPRDPWALTMQHVVATVPAEVEVAAGRPLALVDAVGWQGDARVALAEAGLPLAAADAGEALVDPVGLLADLQRTFPGAPTTTWERTDRIAGVSVRRVETCAPPKVGKLTTVECAGRAEVDGPSSARLFELTTFTTVRWDRRGLRSVESGYNGTLVVVAPGGDTADDRPISGLRRVERRDAK